MIRVLFLRRQSHGMLAHYSQTLAMALEDQGVDVVVDDAESWIPNETGWAVDRKVTKKLKESIKGFDLVHAFGLRSAWACCEAFYVRFPWVYSLVDMPKSRHTQVIDRLNAARRGLCGSRAVRDFLKEAEAMNLEVSIPCVEDPPPLDDAPALRSALGVDGESFQLYWQKEVEGDQEDVFVLESFINLLPFVPRARLVISKGYPLSPAAASLAASRREEVKVLDGSQSDLMWLKASDVALCVGSNMGFSMAAARAMSLGVPCMFRRKGGLAEMAGDGESGFYFDVDSEIVERLRLLSEAPMSVEAVGRGALVRAQDRFDAHTAAAVMARLYRDILDV